MNALCGRRSRFTNHEPRIRCEPPRIRNDVGLSPLHPLSAVGHQLGNDLSCLVDSHRCRPLVTSVDSRHARDATSFRCCQQAGSGLAAQVAPSAELPDIAAGDRKALSRPLRVCAADGASVDRRARIAARSRTHLGAGRRLAELVGNTLGDACRREWVRAEDSEQSKDTPEREHRSELPRNQKLSPAGLIRDGPRWLRDEQRWQVRRRGLVDDPFGHALPQFLCQVVHAGVCGESR